MTDPITLLFALGLGPFCTPLRFKVPVLDSWPTMPPTDEATVRTWLGLLYNVGFRTGSVSGLVVLDDDQDRHGIEADRYVPPPTGLVARTPGGGRHFYYRAPSVALGNSASKLAPYVDVRATGGQVVCPPSVGAVPGTAYVWESTDAPGELPADVLALLAEPAVPRVDMRAPVPSGLGYAQTAMAREVHRVRTATEGARNDTLNGAAFNLGQLCPSGALDAGVVAAELTAAAGMCGLSEHEATATIISGLAGGAAKPRAVPTRSAPTPVTPERVRKQVLVPGSHLLPDSKTFTKQGNDTFADAVFAVIDTSALYRRSGAIGELHDGRFVAIEADRLRSIVDASVELQAAKPPPSGAPDGTEPTMVFRTCSRDNAGVLLRYASVRGPLRELKHIARYPVCIGKEFTPARPGWNSESGVYLACDHVPDPLPLETARSTLEDLVIDFPFATPVDRANYFGLLVTALVRPAISEPVPMHMIGASVMGSGKSKLLEVVLGCGILGKPLPATQLGVREEEIQKEITSAMFAGASVMHFDNLGDFLGSRTIASLLTCSVYSARMLGQTRMLEIPNDATIVASANNIHTSDEIARRIVPIMLQPSMESPENRQNYKHAHLREHVEGQLHSSRAAVLGLVKHWCGLGRPLGTRIIGSFERWSAVVGGIMEHAGYPEYLSNLASWRGASDDFSAELRAFVKLWLARYEGEWMTVETLFALAEEHGLFSAKMGQTTEGGRRTAFGRSVVSAIQNRVIGSSRIEVEGSGKKRQARLVTV